MKTVITTILIFILFLKIYGQYDAIFADGPGRLVKLTSIKDYDLKGKVKSIKQSNYIAKKKNSQIVKGESESGYAEDGSPFPQSIDIEFDEAGRVTQESNRYLTIFYTYNKKGQLNCISTYGEGGGGEICFKHDDKGKILSAYYPEGNETIIKYYYDKSENLIKKEYINIYFTEDKIVEIINYQYDNKGELLESIETRVENDKESTKQIKKYEGTKITSYQVYDNGRITVNEKRSDWETDWDMYENSYLSEFKPTGEYLKYDKHGNWTWCLIDNTSKISIGNKTPNKILIERKLEYYE